FEGDLVHGFNRLVKLGYPAEFLKPIAETVVDDPSDANRWLRRADNAKSIEHMYGVHDLDLLQALMQLLGASGPADDPDYSPLGGRKRAARAYKRAIRRALGAPDAPVERGFNEGDRVLYHMGAPGKEWEPATVIGAFVNLWSGEHSYKVKLDLNGLET